MSLTVLWTGLQEGEGGAAFIVAAIIPSYLFALTLIWMLQRDWSGVRNAFLMTMLLGGGFGAVMIVSFGEWMIGPSRDGFADGLSLPVGVTLEDPKALSSGSSNPDTDRDRFQEALLNALKIPANGPATVPADLVHFEALVTNHPEILMRYLEASPAWRVFEVRGAKYATRRWKIDGEWRYERHGWYFSTHINWERDFFTHRFTIGLDGRPWAGTLGGATRMRTGETERLAITTINGVEESHCVITAGPMVVDCFEQSPGKERRLTNAALAYLEAELAPLAKSPTAETILASLPTEAIQNGDPGIILSGRGGIYYAEIRINPGEPGMIYLKAFEITTNHRLSSKRLKDKSNERTGWSTDSNEKFLSSTRFTIYEGDSKQYYGARFEVWFVPDSGEPERKLLDKNFRIEGWMK
jgi:hypothetical protein